MQEHDSKQEQEQVDKRWVEAVYAANDTQNEVCEWVREAVREAARELGEMFDRVPVEQPGQHGPMNPRRRVLDAVLSELFVEPPFYVPATDEQMLAYMDRRRRLAEARG